MKLLNLGETTVFLDDINLYVPYSKTNTPTEIAEERASGSRTLAAALAQGFLLDVTNGIPAVLPVKKDSVHSVYVPDSVFTPEYDAIKCFKEDGTMSVIWTGSATDASGYSNLNRRFMFGLQEAGVNLKYHPTAALKELGRQATLSLMQLQFTTAAKGSPVVYSMPAPTCEDKDRYRIFLTMMETKRLHPDYVERCNVADEIVVPSRWCKDVFEQSGVTKPVSVVPLGVDASLFKPGAAPLSFFGESKPFVFLSVFQWSLRKGYDVLIRAFVEEFGAKDNVALLVSSRFFGASDEIKKRIIKADIQREIDSVGKSDRGRIAYFGDALPDAMMPSLYAAGDCFVLVSRGEGFGLPYIEAGACGLPVIASRYSGHTDFLNDGNSYLVDVDSFAPADPRLEVVSRFFQGMEFPAFGRAAVDQTRAHMRRVFENRDEAKIKAGRLAADIEARYTWPTCVGQMKQKLHDTFRLLSR